MTQPAESIKVALLDPSLFTGPYDASLTEGLIQAGVDPIWLTRPTRKGDRQELPILRTRAIFYRHVDDATAFPKKIRTLIKGAAHLVGLARMLIALLRERPDVLHVQWVVLPLVDLPVLWVVKKFICPLVLTVHDTVPFNGEQMSLFQNMGFHGPIKLADHVIVHTAKGKARLIEAGVEGEKISVIQHGPLPLHERPSVGNERVDMRWTLVVFGEIKPYKGIDVLIEAAGLLSKEERANLKLVVAGRPRMEMSTLTKRIVELGLSEVFEVTPRRLSEQEMADIFHTCDGFIFPYRQIDASGVYYLVKGEGKWLIASRVGIFAEDLAQEQGVLVDPENPAALADALAKGLKDRPRPTLNEESGSWEHIGMLTLAVYKELSTR